MATLAAAKAEAAGQRDELADSLAELFTNLSVIVRGELQVPPRLESLPVSCTLHRKPLAPFLNRD
jgi:hypothetical protein